MSGNRRAPADELEARRRRARALTVEVATCQREGCGARTEVCRSANGYLEVEAGWFVTPGADRALVVLCPDHRGGIVR